MSLKLLPPNGKRSLEIFQKTTIIKDNRIETVLLWKKEELVLPYNQALALNRYKALEKKFQKNLNFVILFPKQIDGYIWFGHARKPSSKEAETCSEITNCLSNYGVLNINKPGKAHVIFDASPKFQNAVLNDNLLPDIDFLNNLIKVQFRFRER